MYDGISKRDISAYKKQEERKMEDYRVVFGILEALSGIVFAWYINHFLIEKKRLADKRENLNK